METLDDIRKEYQEQDRRCTALPIYVTVQEKIFIGAMNPDYGICGQYGDGEIKTHYKHPELDGVFDEEKDLIKELQEYYEDAEKAEKAEIYIKKLHSGYAWIDIEFFLTVKAAEKFIEDDKHHARGERRTYIHYIDPRNFEMRNLLSAIGFYEESNPCKK